MSPEIIGIIGTLGGTIIGFFLSELSKWRGEKRAKEEQSRSIRALLRLEIDQNYSMLRNFKGWITFGGFYKYIDKKDTESAFQISSEATDRFIELPFPNWHHKAWEAAQTQIAALTAALTEEEILKVHEFHTQLDKIKAIRETLAASSAEYREIQRTKTASGDKDDSQSRKRREDFTLKMVRNRVDQIIEFGRIVDELFKNGNPLATGRSMFCPICEAEYKPGITICSDDKAELVKELTPENTLRDNSEAKFLPLRNFGSPVEAEMVSDILAQNKVRAVVQSGGMDSLSPMLSSVAPGAVILVDERDYNRAQEIYSAFFGNDSTPLTGGALNESEIADDSNNQ